MHPLGWGRPSAPDQTIRSGSQGPAGWAGEWYSSDFLREVVGVCVYPLRHYGLQCKADQCVGQHLLKQITELFNTDISITKNGTQCPRWHTLPFMNRDCHAFPVRLSPHMQVTTLLSFPHKTSALQRPNQILAIYTW